MSIPGPLLSPALETDLSRLYREFFNRAERRRRWSLTDDIPWVDCNPHLSPAIADVVESFMAVEMYLPDYVGAAMQMLRPSRACTWFYANWGYEESKHSLALNDWLLRSGHRSEEQLADLESRVFAGRWNMPHNNVVAMLGYAMVQELATGLIYRNLRRVVDLEGDLALSRVLNYLSVDEQAHHSFFLRAVQLFLEHDRAGTLRQLHSVLHQFAMPAIHELADSRTRLVAIQELHVFDHEHYLHQVYEPILVALGVSRQELRRSA
jgi:acyl-[acyl-carrier-protein] desaturase